MGKSIIQICLFFVIYNLENFALAQGRYDLDVDKLTYDLYLKQNWNGVKQISKTALEREIDFYYLRLRLGIAEDNLGKHNQAEEQYKKAREYMPNDTITNWYRYVSLIKSGREAEARSLAGELTSWQKQISNYKVFRLQSISLDIGSLIAGKSEIIKINENNQINPVQNRTEQERYRNIYYTNLLATIFTGKNIGINLGYGFMASERESNIGFRQPPKDNVTSPSISAAQFSSKKFVTNQNNFYIGVGYMFAKGWSLFAAGNLLSYSGKTQQWASTRNFENTGNVVTVKETSFSGLDYSISVALRKRLSWLGVEGVFAYNHLTWNINSKRSVYTTGLESNLNYLQGGLNLSFYPIGNNRLYLSSGLTYVQCDSAAFIFNQNIGGRVSNWLWAEAYISLGYMQGSMEGNSWIVYNNPDQVSWKSGLNLTFVVNKRIEIPILVGMIRRQGQGLRFVQDKKSLHISVDPYNYNHYIINTGIKIYL